MKPHIWIILTIVLGILTGVSGDVGLHNTQIALALSTAFSGVVLFFSLIQFL